MAIFSSFPLFMFFICCSTFMLLSSNSASLNVAENSLQLATQVCKNTTNFGFCQAAVYSDQRAPGADRYELAYIAFGLAYKNATNTSDYIDSSLKSIGHGGTPQVVKAFKNCRGDYKEAIRALLEVFNNLDSESYYGLDQLSLDVENSARKCEAGFVGRSPMSRRNQHMIQLSNICLVVSKLFTYA